MSSKCHSHQNATKETIILETDEFYDEWNECSLSAFIGEMVTNNCEDCVEFSKQALKSYLKWKETNINAYSNCSITPNELKNILKAIENLNHEVSNRNLSKEEKYQLWCNCEESQIINNCIDRSEAKKEVEGCILL